MLEYVQDGCFSFQFYIKPQLAITILALACRCFSFQFYIKPQQTAFSVRFQHGCFSFQFYIKPQHHRRCRCSAEGCFSFQFYIKPQHLARGSSIRIVVSHSNSTSNHNGHANEYIFAVLFLIPILHQTTTSRMAVIHILHVTHMTPMHKTSCRTPGKLVGCNFVFQRAIYQKNSSC